MSEPEITHDDTETAWRTLAGATSVPSLADLLSPYGEDAGRVMRMQFSTALAGMGPCDTSQRQPWRSPRSALPGHRCRDPRSPNTSQG